MAAVASERHHSTDPTLRQRVRGTNLKIKLLHSTKLFTFYPPNSGTNPTLRLTQQRWDDHGWQGGRMYVIFPLEDLLDPSRGLSRKPTENTQKTLVAQTTNSTEVAPPSASLPNQTIPPDQPSTKDKTVSRSSTPSSTTLTANVSRSGSIRAQSSCTSSALASQLPQNIPTSQVQQHSEVEQIESGSATKLLTVQSKTVDRKNKVTNLTTVQQALTLKNLSESKSPTQVIRQASFQQNLQQQQHKLNICQEGHAKSQAVSTKQTSTSPSGNRTQASIIITPPAANQPLTGSACDKLEKSDSIKQHLGSNRNSWPSNAESQLSPNSTTIVRSSSCRNKESIRPSVPLVSNSYISEVFSAHKIKTNVTSSLGVPKELGIKQKSSVSGAKDSGISAKEFNHNVSSSDVSIGRKDSSLHVESLSGSRHKAGGVSRENSFRNREGVSQTTTSPAVLRSVVGVSEEHCSNVDGDHQRSHSSSRINAHLETTSRLEVPTPKRGESPKPVMAFALGEQGMRQLSHPALTEPLKAHNNVTFKLLKTGEFYIIL